MRNTLHAFVAVLLGAWGTSVAAAPLGTGFTYQGQLLEGSVPNTATACDFQFSLFDAASGGAQVGATQTVSTAPVTNGIFSVVLNGAGEFGATAFDGSNRWLSITVRCPSGAGTFSAPFTPRQLLTAAPNALYSQLAGNVACSGCIGSSDLQGGAIGTAQIGDNQITTAKIQDSQINSAKIADASIGTADLANNAVSVQKIGPGTNGQVLTTVGGAVAWQAPSSPNAWSLAGNAGGFDSLGTIDDWPVRLIVNSQLVLLLQPGVSAPNIIGGADSTTQDSPSGATIGGGGGLGGDFPCPIGVGLFGNTVSDDFGTVGGGRCNLAGLVDQSNVTPNATVAGGEFNRASAAGASIGGGSYNAVLGKLGTVGGGTYNQASAEWTTVAGGEGNSSSQRHASVGGGAGNIASAIGASVDGGIENEASGGEATIGGGSSNSASAYGVVVGGGTSNEGSGNFATVGGGVGNVAAGDFTIVPGGRLNEANGDYSFAGGLKAKANANGAFVWADSTDEDYVATIADTFNVRSTRGLRLAKNAGSGSIGTPTGQYYRDNAIVAWGSIRADGTADRTYGMSSITRAATGTYTINTSALTQSVGALVPVANAEVNAAPTTAAAARLVTINQIDGDTFTVYITTGAYALVDNNFTFIVTGRGDE